MSNQYYDDEEYDQQENFESETVCQNLKKKVNILGLELDTWLVILIVVAIVVYVYRKELQEKLDQVMTPTEGKLSAANAPTITLSTTSTGLGDINKQMGGGYSLSTPDFIRNL